MVVPQFTDPAVGDAGHDRVEVAIVEDLEGVAHHIGLGRVDALCHVRPPDSLGGPPLVPRGEPFQTSSALPDHGCRTASGGSVDAMVQPIGRLDLTAIDCPDPRSLAEFYRAIVGGELHEHPQGGWWELHTPSGKLAFQQIEDHRAVTWPEGDVPQQAHIDIDVEDLDRAEAAVLEVGARKAAVQTRPDDFRVFLDPAGHPFCLVRVASKLL